MKIRCLLRLKVGMALFAIIGGCTPAGQAYQPSGYGVRAQLGGAPSPARSAISSIQLSDLPDTIGIEYSDRINRLNRLSLIYGISQPQIDQLQVTSPTTLGVNYPIPVIRIIFPERVFFDFDKDVVKPEASKVLGLIADNMRRDVPDARVLILGHTDAVGSNDYNIDLSKRRAVSVMQELIRLGVRPSELATVAIGKSQPIAPNDTEEGRALNRRVEFMISASQEANLMLVEKRRIQEAFLRMSPTDAPSPPPATVPFFAPAPPQIAPPSSEPHEAVPSEPGRLALLPPKEIPLQRPEEVQPKEREPVEPQERQLNPEFNP